MRPRGRPDLRRNLRGEAALSITVGGVEVGKFASNAVVMSGADNIPEASFLLTLGSTHSLHLDWQSEVVVSMLDPAPTPLFTGVVVQATPQSGANAVISVTCRGTGIAMMEVSAGDSVLGLPGVACR